jgi:hypothetical protein
MEKLNENCKQKPRADENNFLIFHDPISTNNAPLSQHLTKIVMLLLVQ